jgi:hypothetical protein
MMRRSISKMVTTTLMAVTLSMAAPAFVMAQTTVQGDFGTVIRRPLARGAAGNTLNFARTELFFGTAKPDGVVTDQEFLAFIDAVVTPRFPAGLTLLKGNGQFQTDDGEIIKESSFLLILLYPVEEFRESSRRIDVIRRRYTTQFQQESVLRVDDPFAVRVSF